MNEQIQDPFVLTRFVSAQEGIYPTALTELKAGQKSTHWMWFIFPQMTGLGASEKSRFYAIGSLAEAIAYLQHPLLGARLRECAQALFELRNRSAAEIFGFPDDAKLRSCMTLFAVAAGAESVFARVLARYFAGKSDERTLALLQEAPQGEVHG